MSLNIKSDRVHALAREAALVSGLSQTSAIEAALRQYLRDLGADPDSAERTRRLERLIAIGDRFRAHEDEPRGDVATIDDLYDATTGLPR
ncbi:MAG: type II toxin-antitoxin system VapB family antitoxin [Microbacterium sp.]|uniref:type II toxin-antitoxin system VapB family antitoxin n=1 Tax=Microbacterium sp. TaxID=51671 RepID=UPI0039E21DAB